jgi:hypothetical protein
MAASISSQADAIAPELLDAMVAAQVLSLDHALTMAREIPSAAQRAIALALLGRHPDAPKGLDVEALAARDLVSPHQHLGQTDQLAVDTQLLNILPISVAAPHLGLPHLGFMQELRRPPLHKLFARRFHTMQFSEHPRIAEIFKYSDDVAASELLELINLKRERRNLGRQRSSIFAKLNFFRSAAPKTRAGWELERLQVLTTRVTWRGGSGCRINRSDRGGCFDPPEN